MHRTRFTIFTSALTALVHVILSVLLATSGLVQAQTLDVDPPTIELELVEEGVRGETQVFSATVSDNNQVSSMTLHYRFGGDSSYISAPMSAIAGTSIYTASVDTNGTNASVIQYYMEARDAGDNRTVQGFAFDPFERTLVDEVVPAAVAESTAVETPAEPVLAPRMSTQRKIAYGVIGLLVVGGLASSLGGGGGGGGNPTSSGEQIPVNIRVPVPDPLK